MGSALDDGERVHPESLDEWRAWLAANHARDAGVWLVSWRRRTGREAFPYDAAVEEALCVGWIDSIARPIDQDRSMIWFAPRKRGSVWARSNRERIERLEGEGRLLPAGRAVVERARADGSWSVLIPAEQGVVPDDLAAALDATPGAREGWEAGTPSSRRMALEQVIVVKRPETRARRIAAVVERCARGERPGG